MRVIKPSAKNLIATNLTDDAPLWTADPFSAGAQCRDLNAKGIEKIYQAIVATTNDKPVNSPEIWQEVKTSNRYAMLDGFVDTASQNADSITMTLATSRATHICFFGLVGTSINLVTRADGNEIGNETIDLRISDAVTTFTEYFFSPVEFRSILIHPIPGLFLNVEIDITITASPGTSAQCGFCAPGFEIPLHLTEWGVTVGIDDYSQKIENAFGETEWIQGAYSKPLSIDVFVETSPDGREADKLYRVLAPLRGTPAIYDANNEDTNRETFITLGVYERMSLVASYVNETHLLMEIEGVI